MTQIPVSWLTLVTAAALALGWSFFFLDQTQEDNHDGITPTSWKYPIQSEVLFPWTLSQVT